MSGFKIMTLLEVFIGPMTIYSLPFLCCKWISSRYSRYTKKVIHEKKNGKVLQLFITLLTKATEWDTKHDDFWVKNYKNISFDNQ